MEILWVDGMGRQRYNRSGTWASPGTTRKESRYEGNMCG